MHSMSRDFKPSAGSDRPRNQMTRVARARSQMVAQLAVKNAYINRLPLCGGHRPAVSMRRHVPLLRCNVAWRAGHIRGYTRRRHRNGPGRPFVIFSAPTKTRCGCGQQTNFVEPRGLAIEPMRGSAGGLIHARRRFMPAASSTMVRPLRFIQAKCIHQVIIRRPSVGIVAGGSNHNHSAAGGIT